MATAAAEAIAAEDDVAEGLGDLDVDDEGEEVMVVEDALEPQGNLGIQGFRRDLELSQDKPFVVMLYGIPPDSPWQDLQTARNAMQGRMEVQALEPDTYERSGHGTTYRFETRGLSARYKAALIAGTAKFNAGRDADEIDVQMD